MSVIKKIIKAFSKDESGQSLTAIALSVTMIFGAAALAIDIGQANISKQKLQNAADFAAVAGARELPDASAAKTAAEQILMENGVDPAFAQITAPYQDYQYRIEVICSKEIYYGFAKILGFDSGEVSARAVAERPRMSGPFKFSVFSGNENFELAFNVGDMIIGGSVHSNDRIAMNSSGIVIDGNVEAVNRIALYGSENISGSCQSAQIVAHGYQNIGDRDETAAQWVDMPDLSEEVKKAAQAEGTYYNRSQQFSGNELNFDTAIYVNGDVGFYTPTVISGCGIIMATGNITFGCNCVLAPGACVCFYSKNGDINYWVSEACVNGLLYAPNGAINVGAASFTVNGRVIADKININGATIRVNASESDLECLPKGKVGLIE